MYEYWGIMVFTEDGCREGEVGSRQNVSNDVHVRNIHNVVVLEAQSAHQKAKPYTSTWCSIVIGTHTL